MQRTSAPGHNNHTFVNAAIAANGSVTTPPSEVDAAWLNSVQEELASIALHNGGTLDANNNGQVLAKILEIARLTASAVGTFSGVGKPTAAPTAANPATKIKNSNNELFEWDGAAWVLVGNGLLLEAALPADVNLTGGTPKSVMSITAPRAGRLLVQASTRITQSGTTFENAICWLYKNSVEASRIFALDLTAALMENIEGSCAYTDTCAAGDVYEVRAFCSHNTVFPFTNTSLKGVYLT